MKISLSVTAQRVEVSLRLFLAAVSSVNASTPHSPSSTHLCARRLSSSPPCASGSQPLSARSHVVQRPYCRRGSWSRRPYLSQHELDGCKCGGVRRISGTDKVLGGCWIRWWRTRRVSTLIVPTCSACGGWCGYAHTQRLERHGSEGESAGYWLLGDGALEGRGLVRVANI